MNPFRKAIAFYVCIGALSFAPRVVGQQPAPQPAEKPTKPDTKPELPFQIQLLETHVRFESTGDFRKEVHTIVKINNILGAHQFARLAFDYNRSFQQVEIPQIRISHANGGTSEVLPSAIADAPNPAVEPYPAYHDVRVKSVRILGLQEGDTLEYRVITTTAHHPLAPDFWLEHTFDKSGIVLKENLVLEFPSTQVNFQVNPDTPAETGTGPDGRLIYQWHRNQQSESAHHAEDTKQKPDVSVSTFPTEASFAHRLSSVFYSQEKPGPAVVAKARELTKQANGDLERLRAFYSFVSKNIATVDLPISATGFRSSPLETILQSGAGTAQDKAILLISLVDAVADYHPTACLAFQTNPTPPFYDLPMNVRDVLLGVSEGIFEKPVWLEPALQVAPFGMISSAYRGRPVLCVPKDSSERCGLCLLEQVPNELPFAANQNVSVDASITAAGELKSKVKYTLRGDNELVLRTAFHQTPKEKWKDIANLLALSDGFRGQITDVTASDPLETKDPFTVEYELTQPKFVDWSKTPVRIPALLPQISMPDPPPAPAPGQSPLSIELGTPLEVHTSMTLHLPAGTTVETPPGTSVSRDYATFASKYSATQNTATASRHINFLLRELPADRTIDYNAFFHAVQNDQVQRFTIAASKQ